MPTSLPPPPALDPGWACFLDFDGTLVDLAPTPDSIHVDAVLPQLLADLQRRLEGALALVSGRSLADLDRWLPHPRLASAGLHGLERRDADGRYSVHPAPAGLRDAVAAAFTPMLARHPALLLEDKEWAMAVHYRRAPELDAEIRLRMAEVAEQFGDAVKIQYGKCVAELRPAGIGKGTAVAEFLAEPPFLGRRAVFVGDDLSDAHAFALVNARAGLSIAVGRDDLGARHALKDIAAVRQWLAGPLGTT
jgi:trehalose 6-phosphate phosphatase